MLKLKRKFMISAHFVFSHISLSKDYFVQGSHCELGLPVVRLKNIICEQLFKAVFQAIFLDRC